MGPATDAGTLVQVLARRAERDPGRTALFWEGRSFSYGELWRTSAAFAGALAERGIGRGDRVLLLLPNEPGFLIALYAAHLLAAVPVPLFHLTRDERIAGTARHARPKALVAYTGMRERRRRRLGDRLAGMGVALLDAPAEVMGGSPPAVAGPSAHDLGLLQYTSGSTGTPKAVALTHGALLANVRATTAAGRMEAGDVFVNWVPLYHDLGLVIMSLSALYLGASLVLLPISPDPDSWLSAIQAHGGTVTAAPDFGYRYCIKFTPNPPPYDLSTLRLAINGAEPVRPRTVARFEAKFGLHNVVKPGYGLAEAGAGVTVWHPDEPDLKVDRRGVPSVGPAFPGVEVAIAGERGFLPAGAVGEIVVRSPSNASGYFADPEATRSLHYRDGYIHTGDLGYLDGDGDLFVVGRIKNVINRVGGIVAPVEVEEVVDRVPGVRASAAVGVDTGAFDGEQVIVCAELADETVAPTGRLPDLRNEIVRTMHRDLGFRPNRVLLLRAGTIPHTQNGKIQHAVLRQHYLDGSLERGHGLVVS